MNIAVEVKIEGRWERLAVADTLLSAALEEAPKLVLAACGQEMEYRVRRIPQDELMEGVARARTNDEVPTCLCGRQRCVWNPESNEWTCEVCDK